jgi:hypothetical protein
MQFSSLPINSSLQNNPRYQFSLKSEKIEILPILSAAIRSQLFLVRTFYQHAPIMIWGSFGDFCVCIQTQSNLVITTPRLLSGDVLLFYVSFSLLLLLFLLLLRHPERSRVTYCYSTFLFHYYYYSSTHFCPLYFSDSEMIIFVFFNFFAFWLFPWQRQPF